MKQSALLLKRFGLCAFFLSLGFTTNAQDILWEKSYGGKHADFLFDVIPTPDYGFILAGSSLSKMTGDKTSDNRGDLDYWVWKMDEKGEFEWQKSFGGAGQDLLQRILLTNDGGFLLAGSSDSGLSLDKKEQTRGESDFWIIKLNAKGDEEWQKTIGGIGKDALGNVVKTRDGGFVLAGSSSSDISNEKTKDGFGGMDYWVVKIDSKGKVVWQNTFGGIYNDDLKSILATQDGGFLLGGSSNSPDSGNKLQKNLGHHDYWIVKIDDKGQEQWQKTIGGTGDDELTSLCETYDGHYLLGGNSNSESSHDKKSSNQSGTDFWVIKINKESQEMLWQETYNIAKADILTSMIENDDHTLLLGGYAQGEPAKKSQAKKLKSKKPTNRLKKASNNTVFSDNEPMKQGTDDYFALKINEKGEELWRKNVGSEGKDVLIKAIETRDGGYLMAGTSKTIVTVDGGVKATGNKSTGKGSNDFWVVKLKDKQKPKPVMKPVEAIPNPAGDYTNIIVGNEYTKGTATLVDIAGHILQQFPITERTIPLNLEGLPEGVYVINIRTDVQNSGVKILKQQTKN